MTKRMLIDTTHAEETRVVVLDGNRLDDYDVETSAKKQLKGNIYLAKIVRIEPSLQAAFVEYGGNRHGFLAFSEIHPDYYQIPVADRERLIALQEEEARAEEARADREDENEAGNEQRSSNEQRSGNGDTSRAGGNRRPVSAPLEIAAETFHGEPDGQPDSRFDEDLANDDQPADDTRDFHATEDTTSETSTSDNHAVDYRGSDNQASDDQASDDQGGEQSDEPAPETVGGESADDGQAQRRTARFLRQYKIQEVMRRRQILLIQVVKEERGNKGAALTTYISLAGRFSVLMPNSLRGGGVSRKITSAADRRRLKEITTELEIPRGMAMIVRTAGAQRPRPEIRRDCEYLLRTWDDIRETTLASSAPCLVYEEASLIKRAIRDVYTRDVEEIVVDGEPGWRGAREFMRMLMPSNAGKVNLWRDPAQKLFSHYQVEHHLDAMLQPTVQLRSGGYLVINQTEALVAIDVNSGRSTRERGIEETALRTNMEAADEVARQLRLRDLAGLIVIDFIDMEAKRNNAMVERRLKEALRNDRARIQVGTISHFGLMEMSRQRLRPSLAESSFVPCPHCAGSGFMRGTESSALHVLRAIEEEAGKRKAGEILVYAASSVALYVLNNKRAWLQEIESRHYMTVHLAGDDSLIPPAVRIEKIRPYVGPAIEIPAPAPSVTRIPIEATAPPADIEADAQGGGGADWKDEPALPVARANGRDLANRAASMPTTSGEPVADPVASGLVAVPGQSAAETEEAEHHRKRRRRRRRGGRREDGMPLPEGTAQPDLDQSAGFDADDMPGEDGAPSPSLQLGEHLDNPSVFETGTPDHAIAPIESTADASTEGAGPAEGTGRGRRRRGGNRNRPRPDAAPIEIDDAEQTRRAPRPYNGPTPADPFAGSFDIFDMIEREADESLALASNPSASAASHAAREPEPELVEPEAVRESVEETVAEPAQAEAAAVEVAVEAIAEPVAVEAIAEPVAAEAIAEPVTEATPELDAKPARTPRARKPRVSRAAKPEPTDNAAIDATPLPDSLLDPVIGADPVVAEPAPIEVEAPVVVRKPRASTRRPKPAVGSPEPEAPVVAPEPEAAAAVPAPDAAPARDPSIVQPIVIGGDTPAPARRTGWWKR